MLITITGYSMEAIGWIIIIVTMIINLDITVMFMYLLEMHALVLFLTGFPNLELYFSVLCFQFLILESTKKVVTAAGIGIVIHFTTASTESTFYLRYGDLEAVLN